MRYLTVNYTVTFPNPTAKPIHYSHSLLRTPDGETFYHPEGGPSHFYRKDYEIVTDHGELDLEDDWDKIESLVLANFKNHHRPEKAIRSMGGWLSPDGSFYPCKEWEHDGLARRICRAEIGLLKGTRYLEEHDWLRIYDDGLVALSKPATQQQKNTLWDLHQASKDENYKHQIKRPIR